MIMIEASYSKTVSFADERNTKHIYEALSTDVLWEWPEFFTQCRTAARRDGSQLKGEGLDKLLEGCFCNTRHNIQKCLNEYTKLSEGRGVERFVCRSMYHERKQERSQAIKAILIGQTQGREKGLPEDVMREELREVALVYGLNAKVFARRIGKADEYACYPKKKSSLNGSSHHSVASAKSKCSRTTKRATAVRAL